MSDQSLNTEVLRLQCLQALGIAVYHPRFRLPGAKPSELGPWVNVEVAPRAESPRPAASASSAVSENVQQRAPQRSEVPLAPTQAPAHTPAKTPTPAATPARSATPPTPAPVPRAAETPQVAIQNFQLLFLQVDDDLAIVNQVPALARPQLQEKQFALLSNLLRWLGKSAPAQAPRVFRWPLPGLEHMAASMNAQTSLQHFLEQASSERGFRFLLQLGPQAVAPEVNAWQAFATHSLDEMLALPSLKREVWQTLLPLHELLRGLPNARS